MSDLAKTEHLPAMRGGRCDRRARSPNSRSIDRPSRLACWSRNDPVPAAQTVFIEKSSMMPRSEDGSSRTRMSLESSPPISMIVRAPGQRRAAARACAMISFTNSAPRISQASLPPEPVAATARIRWSGCAARSSRSIPSITESGWPRCRRYQAPRSAPPESTTAVLTLTEPTSMPTYRGPSGGATGRALIASPSASAWAPSPRAPR